MHIGIFLIQRKQLSLSIKNVTKHLCDEILFCVFYFAMTKRNKSNMFLKEEVLVFLFALEGVHTIYSNNLIDFESWSKEAKHILTCSVSRYISEQTAQ